METFGRSDLGNAEDRLRRVLGLEGRVPIEYTERASQILPVVVVADGLMPGANVQHGRSWSFVLGGLATGQNVAMAQSASDGAPIVVDSFEASILGGTANQDLIALYQYPLGAGTPVVPTGTIAQFTERYVGDLAPVLTSSGAGAAAVSPIGTWILGGGVTRIPDLRICLDRGTVLAWRWVASVAGTLNLTVRGRVF